MREVAVNVRRHNLPRRADVGLVELVITGDAEQRQTDADFVFEGHCAARSRHRSPAHHHLERPANRDLEQFDGQET